MRIAHLEFRPSLLPSLAFVLMFALLVSLGLWQLQRAVDKEKFLSDRSERASRNLLDLNLAAGVGVEDRFRPAVAVGRYLNERQWLLDNRVVEGRPGYHVFSMFELQDPRSPLLLVNRGWVPVGESRQFLPDLPLPDDSSLRIIGRLDRPASVGIRMGEARLDSLARLILVPYLDIQALEQALGRSVYRFALVLDEQQAGSLRRDWVRAEQITPDKHLGYAVQWFALALALTIIYVGINSRRIDRGDRDD